MNMSASEEDSNNTNVSLKVPAEMLSNTTSRPASPVNRKRTDDDSTSGSGHHRQGSSASNNSLPPTKKSKTSPPLAPIQNTGTALDGPILGGHGQTDYRQPKEIVDDTISPQTSPMLEPSISLKTVSSTEKRYSPVADVPMQSKARKLDDNDRPTSPSFRAGSPPFRVGSPPLKTTSPSLGRSATAILDSLSKPGENSLGNLNLGTPVIGRTPVGERVMGVITSQPNSRQSSPDPYDKVANIPNQPEVSNAKSPMETEVTSDVNVEEFNLDDIPDTSAERIPGEPSPAGAMRISSDDEDPVDALAEEPMHEVEEYSYDSEEEDEFGQDSMDEIDIESIGMPDYDSDSESVPYKDPDPSCLDRFTKEEADAIIDDVRMHGIKYVIQKYVVSGLASIKKMLLLTFSEKEKIELSDNLTERYLLGALSDRLKKLLRRRQKLQHVNTLEDVVSLLKSSKQIMVLTGAGVSVSCGIPDFRSEDGIYSRLSEFELDDPQQMFDLEFFRERPQIFYSFAREIFPSNFTPSPSHYFIKLLEDQGKLLRNYTQNIDTLEQKAGIQKVLECHGSFATASCVRCGHQVRGDEIKEHIFKQEVAYCKVCKTPTPPPKAKAKSKKRSKSGYHSSDEDSEESDGDDMNKPLMKPDIVFFGEKLPDVFHTSLKEDRGKADLLIVIGSSLKVAPVSDIMHQLPHSVPQILINRTPNHQTEFDVQLLGNCDTIVAELCRMAGWELKHERLPRGTSTVPDMDKYTNEDGSGAGGRAAWSFVEPNVYLFDGADPEELNFQAIQERYRRKPRGEIGGLISVGGHDSDVEDEEDEENDENEENDDSGSDSQAEGSEHASNDLEDMEGLTTEISKRRLTPSQPDRAGSTGLMDEDHVDLEQSSEHNQDITRTASANINTSASNHTVITPLEPLQSPSLQPAGLATGTTEPRSGSIQHIHDQHPEADSSRPLPALATIGTVALKDPIVHSDGDDEDDEDEEKKIRVMFAEKMPKDLGEDDDLGLSRIHSRRPSMDLMPITEDAQEVEVDDGSSDGGGHDSQAIEAERAN